MSQTARKLISLLLCLTLFTGVFATQAFAEDSKTPSVADVYAAYNAQREAYMRQTQRQYEQAAARMREWYTKMLLRYAIAVAVYEVQKETVVAYNKAFNATMQEKYERLVAEYEATKQKALQAQQELEAAQLRGAQAAQAAIDAAAAAWQDGTLAPGAAIQQAVNGYTAATDTAQEEIQAAVEDHSEALSDYAEGVDEIDEEYAKKLKRLQEELERRLREQAEAAAAAAAAIG